MVNCGGEGGIFLEVAVRVACINVLWTLEVRFVASFWQHQQVQVQENDKDAVSCGELVGYYWHWSPSRSRWAGYNRLLSSLSLPHQRN